MGVRRDVIEGRLAKIDEAIAVIERALAAGPDLSGDVLKLYAAEHALQLAIEASLDVGSHIIAGEGWQRPATYSEVFSTLGKRGVLPEEFARRIGRMAGLRNLLVHEYMEINPDLLLQALSDVEDFRTFSAHVLAYLRSRQTGGRPSQADS